MLGGNVVIETSITSFVVAVGASAICTPIARLVARRFNVVSNPGGRHIHGHSIPRLGGVGIFAAVGLTILGLYTFGHVGELLDAADRRRGIGLMLGGFLMFGVGLFDDVRGMRAGHKLLGQVLAALVAWSFGFRMDVVSLPLLGDFSMGVFSLPVTVLWIVGIINAVNLIDGLDGLAAGVVFFAGITNFVVAYLMGTTFVAFTMATMAGAVLGFLFYNFNPARIFMGDSGSYFLGFILAACSIAGPLQKASATVSIAVPVVALGVPIIDTLLAMVRRFLEKRPIFSPDRGHIHHRLLDMGITHRRAVLIIYGVTVALCVGSIALAFGRNWMVGAAVLGVSAVLFGLVRFIGYFEYLTAAMRQKQRIRSRHVEWLKKCILHFPRHLESAHTEEAVLEGLAWLAREARLDFAEILKRRGERDWETLQRWQGDDYQDMDARDVSVARFPLGPPDNGYQLNFGWRSEYGDVPPQMEILLELATDALAAALKAVGSEKVRVPEPKPSPAGALTPVRLPAPAPDRA